MPEAINQAKLGEHQAVGRRNLTFTDPDSDIITSSIKWNPLEFGKVDHINIDKTKPISPNKQINIILGLIAAIVCSISTAFIIEYFDNTQDFIQSIIIGKFKQYDLFCEQYLQKLLIMATPSLSSISLNNLFQAKIINSIDDNIFYKTI